MWILHRDQYHEGVECPILRHRSCLCGRRYQSFTVITNPQTSSAFTWCLGHMQALKFSGRSHTWTEPWTRLWLNTLWPSEAIWQLTSLAMVMACCLMVPSHYLKSWTNVIKGVLWHSPAGHFIGRTMNLMCNMYSKIPLSNSLPYLQGANALSLSYLCNYHTVCNAVFLIHWGRLTHICIGKRTIFGSDNGLPPGRRQAIIWTSAGILLIGPLGTNFSEILTGIQTFSFKKMHLKMSGKWCPFCLGLNVITVWAIMRPVHINIDPTHSRPITIVIKHTNPIY